ncbi:MAG: hypothetical protein WD737_05520 [Gemmatimonadota bacterium]
MRGIIGGLVALALLTFSPDLLQAQQTGWWDWALREVERSRDVGRDSPARGAGLGDIIFGQPDRNDRRQGDRSPRGGRGADAGPPFCRTGEGHPVFGVEWCYEKGFGVGSRSVRWEDRGWEDIIFGAPDRRRSGTLNGGGLADVLGGRIYSRLVEVSRAAGGGESLVGRWVRTGGTASVLQIRSGSLPIAELTDVNGDGRVDAVLVPRS